MMNLIKRVKGHAIAFFSGLLSALAMGLYFFCRRRPPGFDDQGLADRQAERKRRAEEETAKAIQEERKASDRKEQFEQADKIRDKIISGGLIILLTLGLLGMTARATEPGPFIPEDYATLKQYYLATWDLSERYRGLYTDAECSVSELRESNAKLLTIIEEQAKEIEALRAEIKKLRAPSLSFGFLGGVTWSPGGPGAFLGGEISW